MSDTISRQAAIDTLEERLQANGYSNVALVSELNRSIGYLMQLPSAQPGWIPVTERLPEDFTDVLVCLHDIRCGCEDQYYITSAYSERGYWEMTLDTEICDLEVVAWMPLPTPYRERGQDDSIRTE